MTRPTAAELAAIRERDARYVSAPKDVRVDREEISKRRAENPDWRKGFA